MKIRLDDIEKKEPFQTPEGYFEGLSDKIMDRIEAEEASQKTVHLNPWMGYVAAACIGLIAIAFLFSNPSINEPTAAELLAQVSDEDILNYLVSSDITTDEILQHADFDIEDAAFLEDETMPDYDLSEIDAMIEELDFIDLENNTL